MNRIIKSILFAGVLLCTASCYEDYINDYEYPNMGFALTKQVRTVVADKNQIYVGVSIGGKREIDMNDWAEFVVDESLLEGTSFTLLPENYYSLSDGKTMRVRKQNIAVADVGVSFTDDFYNDPKSTGNTYALPLRITKTSITSAENPDGAIREGGESAVIVIKYISSYSGTYYRVGSEVEVDVDGNETGDRLYYEDKDLSRNQTVQLSTVSRYCVSCKGLGTYAAAAMRLYVTKTESQEAYTVRLESDDAVISDFKARYVMEGDYTFYSGDEVAPQFELEYTYSAGGKTFKVSEKLVLRQWPESELKVETF